AVLSRGGRGPARVEGRPEDARERVARLSPAAERKRVSDAESAPSRRTDPARAPARRRPRVRVRRSVGGIPRGPRPFGRPVPRRPLVLATGRRHLVACLLVARRPRRSPPRVFRYPQLRLEPSRGLLRPADRAPVCRAT